MKSENLEVTFSLGDRLNASGKPYIEPHEPTRSLSAPLYNIPIKSTTKFITNSLLDINFEYSMPYTNDNSASFLFMSYKDIVAKLEFGKVSNRINKIIIDTSGKHLTKNLITNLFNGVRFEEPTVTQKVYLFAIVELIIKLIPRWNKHNEK